MFADFSGDLNAEVAHSLSVAFSDADQVEVVEGNLLDLNCEAIVSPANSFGDMGGGIDKVIDDFHKGAAQSSVMAAIAEQFFGELPVGAALIVDLATDRWPYIIAAPTMRVPQNVGNTINAYLSMRAALVAVLKYRSPKGISIRSLAMPDLATGVGGMDYAAASQQMKAAYDSVIGGQWRQVFHAAQAPYAWTSNYVD